MFLWEPSTSQKPIARMTGHLQLINQVRAYMVATFIMHVAAACLWEGSPP